MATISKDFRIKSGLVVEGLTTAGILTTTSGGAISSTATIGNSYLTNSSITVNGTGIALGGSATITANTSNSFTIKADSGTTEGTDLYTFNGGSAKTINIVAGTGVSIAKTAGTLTISTTNAGTVTSVTGTSPVVSSGGSTPAISLASGYGDTQNPYASKTANYFLAAPNGSSGAPTFRAIVAADIPTLNQSTTGNAATATALQTARTINGTSFDGTANITVTAAAGTLTGTALNSTVVSSSLTSVGTLTTLTTSGDVTVGGNLTVNGTTTTINSTTITVDDKNIELGSIASPTDTTADGAGITVLGTTNKTWNWINATSSWTSSENIDLASGKVIKIAGTQVLSATNYTGNAATVTNGVYTTDTGTVTNTMLAGSIANSKLLNSSITVNGTSISLGASGTVTVPVSTGVTGLGTGVATALAVNVGSSGAVVVNGGALGTPTSGTLTNATGLPISTGVSGLGTNVATFLATPSSSNLAAAVTDETGSGALVFGTSPSIASPTITGTTSLGGNAGIVTGSGSGSTLFTISTLFDKTVYNGGEFTVKLSDGTDFEIIRLLVVIKGTTFYVTQYGDVQSNGSLGTIDFTLSTNTVNMTVTPVAGTVSAKVVGTLLAA